MANNQATVVSGVERISTSEIVGLTVDDIRDQFSDLLNISDEATALVGGNSVEGNYTLKAGDELVFSRVLGSKG